VRVRAGVCVCVRVCDMGVGGGSDQLVRVQGRGGNLEAMRYVCGAVVRFLWKPSSCELTTPLCQAI
jgi:hypothetical protein